MTNAVDHAKQQEPADELLYGNDHARVWRRRLGPGRGTVIVKQAIGAQAIRRLEHEATMLRRLAEVEGVAHLADSGADSAEPHTLVLRDDASLALAEHLREHRMSPAQVLAYGAAVARILAAVHRAGVLHKDIGPANLLIEPATLRPTLIDFNIAGLIAEQAASGDEAGALAGTLATMSPEQTGRSGRAPDARSDLYSLGITLYELCTGRKPFESTDLLELVHDHLVRVPQAPLELNPELPPLLSAVVMRLLEKEPDRRYQSAVGLAADLERLGRALAAGEPADFTLGASDFGVRLLPPPQPLGREAELATLRAAVAGAGAGTQRLLLIDGVAGSGKSTLLAQVRGLAAAHKAWYVASACEGSEHAANEPLRALGRQLLALPAEPLAALRERLLADLGTLCGVGPTRLPEFVKLLGEHPAPEDETEAQALAAALALLRGVASAERTLLLALDDLHRAPPALLRLVQAVVDAGEPLPGLCLVATLDRRDLQPAHPLAALCARPAQPVLTLGPLAPAAAATLVGSMLRLPEAEATRLATVLGERTGHLPRATVDWLNALRDDGLLQPQDGLWHWDATAVRRYVGNASAAEIVARLQALPAPAATLLRQLACLGEELEADALAQAGGPAGAALAPALAAAVEAGLLADAPAAQRPPLLRFTNARVRQAVLSSLDEAARCALHLALARALVQALPVAPGEAPAAAGTAPAEDPAEQLTEQLAEQLAAQQYLAAAAVLPAQADEAERRRAAALFDRAAQRLRLVQPDQAEHFLAAAITLLKSVETPADAPHLFALETEHHRALFTQGRLEEGDALYEALVAHAADPVDLNEPTRIQIYSLTNRQRFADGTGLGLSQMNRLGLPKPADIRPDLAEGMKRAIVWSRGQDKQRDFERPEVTDPRVIAWSCILPETSTPAYFADIGTWAWLALTGHKLWIEHGPSPRLLSGICSLPFLMVGTPQDYRGAYEAGRHLLAVGEARGYEPATSFGRCIYGIAAGHWVEPIEAVVREFHRARADLQRLGDESFVSYTYLASDLLLDCSATLEPASDEVDAGLAFAARSKNQDYLQRYQPRRQLIRALRGQTAAPGSFSDAEFDEAAYAQAIDPTGPTAAVYHMVRAIGAAIFGDFAQLLPHTTPALPLSARTPGYYLTAMARTLHGLGLAEKARAAAPEDRAAVLEELDASSLKWLSARAADAPENFLHLQRWLEAERAWAADSVWAAGQAFDAAVQESLQHARPWHRALIHERAALFHLAHGMEHSALPLMLAACEAWDAWGATGKAQALRRAHPFLRAAVRGARGEAAPRSTTVDTGMVDMMAVLRASQALSSETSLARLTAQVGKVLGAITGATGVQLVVHPDEGSRDWVMAQSLGGEGAALTVDEAGARGELPLSVFRYVERTGELLVIDDVTRDDRFSADPYAERFAQCSLLVAPILKQGQLNAMLVLENQQRRGAFRGDRLDAVNMIAGQLSVSLDNALLYASLEKRVAERTAQLRQKTNDINAMLQNMPQGVLTVEAGGRIHPEYSAYLETILETADIAGQDVMALLMAGSSLGEDLLSQVDAALGSCLGEDAMNYEFNAHLLPTEFDKTLAEGRVKSLALSWSPIVGDEGNVDKLMICVRDVTELKRLEAEAGERKRELDMIGEILAVSQEKFHAFVASARNFLDENRRHLQQAAEASTEGVNLLFRNMHTIKGNARTYGLLGLTNLVHVAEQSYDELRRDPALPWPPERLLAELEAVSTMLERYAQVNDNVLGRKGPGRRGGVEKFLMVEREQVQQTLQMLLALDTGDTAALRDAVRQVGRLLHLMGTEPVHDVLAGTLDALPSLARELGKEPPRVRVQDHGLVVRTQAAGLLKNLFTHLLRNSVDHGLEPAAERLAAGKPAAGEISLTLAVDDGQLQLRLRDDGRGLALGKIRERAREQGLIGPDERPTPEALAELIFHAGLSTAEQVTEVSGRGVGMDAVREFLLKEGGRITLRLLDGDDEDDYRAFETVIALPDKFAASADAAMSFDALCARLHGAAAATANTTR